MGSATLVLQQTETQSLQWREAYMTVIKLLWQIALQALHIYHWTRRWVTLCAIT